MTAKIGCEAHKQFSVFVTIDDKGRINVDGIEESLIESLGEYIRGDSYRQMRLPKGLASPAPA